MAKAWLLIGSVNKPILVEREMAEDRSGSWYVSGHHRSSVRPRYRTGDGMLYWDSLDAYTELSKRLHALRDRLDSRVKKVDAWITVIEDARDNAS